MSKKKIEFLPITYLLVFNNIQYEIIQKCFKFTMLIPSLNMRIDKYHLSSNYYIYIQEKFLKKISEQEFIKKYKITEGNTNFDLNIL